MFNYVKKSFFILLSLGVVSPTYAINIQSPFSYVYNKLHQYHYTFPSIIKAAQNNNFANWEAIKKSIENGSNVNCRIGKKQKTLLMLAVEHSNKAFVEYLLQNGAHVNNRDKNGQTPIVIILAKILSHNNTIDQQIFEILLQHGADINHADINCKIGEDEETLLMLAIESLNETFIDYLLKHGANVNARAMYEHTPLSIIFIRLLFYNNDEPNKIIARQIFEKLLQYGADINCKVGYGEEPLLMLAIEYDRGDLVKYLLEHGADVSACNIQGETPLSTVLI